MEDLFNKKDDRAYPGFIADCNKYGLDLDVKSRMSSYLLRTSTGSDSTYMSPPYDKIGTKDILADIDGMMAANTGKLNTILQQLETEQRAKIGPRSIAKSYEDRIPQITSHFGSGDAIPKLKALSSDYKYNLRPLAHRHAISLLKNDTNSGLPYFTRKSKVKDRLLKEMDEKGKIDYPCILFTRTQEGNKTRDVWGYPIYDTLKEMRYYKPLLDVQKKVRYRKALLSPDSIDSAMTSIINKANNNKSTSILVSIDFSSFDSTIKKEIQKVCFEYIKECFQPVYHSEIDDIFNRFNSIALWTPKGIIQGEHGVPSGSTFTNEVDSIAQATIALGNDYVELDNFQVQGDDGVYLIPTNRVDNFLSSFSNCGLRINQDKSSINNRHCFYLQCLYDPFYRSDDGIIRGIYPIYRALNRIMYQERWQDFEDYNLSGKDYYSIRNISILENVKQHPLFEDFVKIVLKYDKYHLDFNYQSLTNYVEMVGKTKGNDDFMSHRYGDNIKGIKNFETFKLIQRIMGRKRA